MIAIDSSVLIRYIARDDAAQSALAAHVLEVECTDQSPAFVSIPALVEMIWVLRTSYRYRQDQIRIAVNALLNISQVEVAHADAVAAALESDADGIADAIIHELGRAAGCSETVTFDRRFAKLDGVRLIA